MPFIDVEDPYGGPRLDLPACFYANTLQSVYGLEDMAITNSRREVCQAKLEPMPPAASPSIVLRIIHGGVACTLRFMVAL